VTTPSFVDGRSLKPLFTTDAPDWRTAFLVASWDGSSSGIKILKHNTVRTAKHKYTYYPATKEKEPYNLANDPYETQSIRGSTALESRLGALRACAGESCRAAEDGL
jgi:hypothetical protein